MVSHCKLVSDEGRGNEDQRRPYGPMSAWLRKDFTTFRRFFSCCMECQRGLAMRKVSVCLSVKRVDCDKTEVRSVQIFIPYEISFSLVFWEEEWLVGGDPFYLNFMVNWPPWSEIADFEPILARSASAVKPSGKRLINTNR